MSVTYFVLRNLQYSWEPGCTAQCPCDRGSPPSSCQPPPASPHSARGSLSAWEAAGRDPRDAEASWEFAATTTRFSSASHLREMTRREAMHKKKSATRCQLNHSMHIWHFLEQMIIRMTLREKDGWEHHQYRAGSAFLEYTFMNILMLSQQRPATQTASHPIANGNSDTTTILCSWLLYK